MTMTSYYLMAMSLILLAYLLGSFSSAVIVCRFLKLPDPRLVGSGNPGATNVLRCAGKKAAVFTLLLDVAKGFFPVYLALSFSLNPTLIGATALATFFGHLYPIYFDFQGGKGVATSFGLLLGIAWQAALFSFATWLSILLLFRYSSLAALSSALAAPFFVLLISDDLAYMSTISIVSTGLVLRHRNNIHRLMNGQENKLK